MGEETTILGARHDVGTVVPLERRAGSAPVEDAFAQPIRRERLIAGCRVTLALFSLVALWLDPSEPLELVSLVFGLLLSYSAWSLVSAGLAWSLRTAPVGLPLMMHVVDFGVLSLVILLTEGWGASPFFLLLVFLLAAATVRWRQPGTIWTALALLGLLLLNGLYSASVSGTGFDLRPFMVRSIQLGVVAVLLGYLGAYEQRLRSRVAALSSRPGPLPTELRGRVAALLSHAAAALNAPRMVLAWTQPGQPWLNVGSWTRGDLVMHREREERRETLAPPEFVQTAFLVGPRPPRATQCRLLLSGGSRGLVEDPLPGWLRARTGAAVVMSIPLRGASVVGRLYAVGPQEATSDDLVLADVLARQIAARMDQLVLWERFHLGNLAEERIRLARDLHDGVIQSLAAGALRLEAARYQLGEHPHEASRAISEVQDLLLAEQQELREIVASLQPESAACKAEPRPLPERLERLAQRLKRHWGLDVDTRNRLRAEQLPGDLSRELFWVVREGLVNAVRHGRATHARISLEAANGSVLLRMSDNGCGFRFRGRYDFSSLTGSRLGPFNLGQRVASLGGQLEIESGDGGATLDITIPRQRPGAAS